MKTTLFLMLLLISAPSFGAQADHSLNTDALQQALLAPERDVADRIRDAARQPVAVLEFLELRQGMQVLDLYAANGYYTYILATAVGPEGTVFAQNSPQAASFEDNIGERSQSQALASMLNATGLENVRPLLKPSTALGLPADSIDFVLVSQILHDYLNANTGRALQLLQSLYELVTPGGIVGLIDHVGLEGLDNSRMHRMTIESARALIAESGFILEEESSLLHNPRDTHRRSIFDPMLNRQSDQFLFRLRKPLNP